MRKMNQKSETMKQKARRLLAFILALAVLAGSLGSYRLVGGTELAQFAPPDETPAEKQQEPPETLRHDLFINLALAESEAASDTAKAPSEASSDAYAEDLSENAFSGKTSDVSESSDSASPETAAAALESANASSDDLWNRLQETFREELAKARQASAWSALADALRKELRSKPLPERLRSKTRPRHRHKTPDRICLCRIF